MKNKDQILLEQEYNKILDDSNKSNFEKRIEKFPEDQKPEIKKDDTSKMKGNSIPIETLEVGKIYDVLVKHLSEQKDNNKIYIEKKEGYKCHKPHYSSLYYLPDALFDLKSTSVGPGSINYVINKNGDTQWGYHINVSVYESDITPEQYEQKLSDGEKAFYNYEQEYKQRHGRDSSPWD